ncbi:MAG: DNA phosphorothioation-dependent restriction protein DptG, partial [Fusobacteriaceae bacterium]
EFLKKQLNYNDEKKQMRHNLEKGFELVPFKTRGDDKIDYATIVESIKELARTVSGKSLEEKLNMEEVVESILSKEGLQYENESDKDFFRSVLQVFLERELLGENVKNPYFLKFTHSYGKDKKIKDTANYMYVKLLNSSNKIEKFFQTPHAETLISKLVVQELERRMTPLKNIEKEVFGTEEREPLFHDFIQCFNEDMEYLARYPEQFLKSMGLFFNYYLMRYIFQIVFNINLCHRGQFQNIDELFFALDSETISMKRATYNYGYRYFKESSLKTYYHMNTLEHLGIFLTEPPFLYSKLENSYHILENCDKENFISILNLWMEEYAEANRIEGYQKVEHPSQFKDIYSNYLSLIEKAHSTKEKRGTYLRYTSAIEEICREQFLKARGSLGFTFNLSQSFILLLTRLCVKEKSIQVKELFLRFQKRGIFLDRNSKESVITILEKNNLLEKNSDGGEVQYVKAVL